MFRTHREYLEYYYKRYKYNFKVQRYVDFPHRWLNYNTDEYNEFVKKNGYINNREVFPDEIVVDLDIDSDGIDRKAINKEVVGLRNRLSSRFVALNINHEIWKSGGDGEHIHMMFPSLFEYGFLDRKLIKREFIRTFGRGHLRNKINTAHICSAYKPMITLEKTKNRKGGIKKLVKEVIVNYKQNILPEIVTNRAIENKKNFIKKEIKYVDGKPQEIALLEKEDFLNMKDGRRRALFVLSSYYCCINKNDDDVFTILSEWNKYKLNAYFNSRTILNEIKYRRRSSSNTIPIIYARVLLQDMEVL